MQHINWELDAPCEPQWNCEISSGRETETRSLMPTTRSTAARKARGGDCISKEREFGCGRIVRRYYHWRSKILYQAHGFSYYENKCLICYGAWRSEEEECEGNVEKREGCNDCCARDERHVRVYYSLEGYKSRCLHEIDTDIWQKCIISRFMV